MLQRGVAESDLVAAMQTCGLGPKFLNNDTVMRAVPWDYTPCLLGFT